MKTLQLGLLAALLALCPLAALDAHAQSTWNSGGNSNGMEAPWLSALGHTGFLPVTSPSLTGGAWITPQQAPTDVEQYRFALQLPIYNADKDRASLGATGSDLHFGAQQTLAGSGIGVPVDLWKGELSGSYAHELDGDRIIGGRLSLGSASNHPFADWDVTTVGAAAYYGWTWTARSRWLVTLFFSNNNPITNYIPIPGIIYLYQTKTFTGMFGLPFSSILWRPMENWGFLLSFFGPTIRSEIAYGGPKAVQIFAGYNWTQQSFLRDGRPDVKDRLYFNEMRVPLGLRFPVADALKGELSGGYAFDRSLYEGIRFENKTDGDVDLGASWFASLDLRLAW